MKIFCKIFCFILLTAYGCSGESQILQQAIQTSTVCPDKPTAILNANNVKEISLNSQILKIAGQASANQPTAYIFEAIAGQEFTYKTSEDICLWLYTPDNQILTSGILPISGKYMIQVAARQGSTSFNLEMSLKTENSSQAAVINNEIPKPPASNSKNTSISSQTLGWIWLGSVNNTSGVFSYGEPLIPSKLQPVTITPSVVPSPGAVVTIKTQTNRRANVPQPPDFKLANRAGKPFPPGQKLVILRVEGFLDQNSQSKNTRVWAQVGKP
ncbi:hypothetical protein [Nodularia spumigena]|uniref:hypothetical protein n=1 Tax=Nodularia spumigena TaxID=70799 RepID=UPI000D3261C2|nr:hypothetical protein [Nodularia spumigena]